jgi:hypothetical protein
VQIVAYLLFLSTAGFVYFQTLSGRQMFPSRKPLPQLQDRI